MSVSCDIATRCLWGESSLVRIVWIRLRRINFKQLSERTCSCSCLSWLSCREVILSFCCCYKESLFSSVLHLDELPKLRQQELSQRWAITKSSWKAWISESVSLMSHSPWIHGGDWKHWSHSTSGVFGVLDRQNPSAFHRAFKRGHCIPPAHDFLSVLDHSKSYWGEESKV